MNICLVSSEYPTDDHKGGIATYTEKTAHALTRLGHSVHVITEARGAALTQSNDRVSVIRLAATQRRPHFVARSRAVAHALHALPYSPDIVQACEYQAEAFWYALRKHPGTSLVTRLATPSFLIGQLNNQSGGDKVRTRLRDRLERLQTHRSDAIISPTDALAEIVCRQWQIPRPKVRTIRTGVDFGRRYASNVAELPFELRDKEYLLYFGRLEERKGVHILAQALPRVLAAYPQLHVVFAGTVQQYKGQSLQAFVEKWNKPYRNRLFFFPQLAQQDLYPVLNHALFSVLPSLWENLSNACLESLDMGKPVVATLGCGFSEVIDHGRSGLLVPPGDVAALEDALLSLLSDRRRLLAMSQHARTRADHFSLDAVTRDLLRFYEALRNNTQFNLQEPCGNL